MSKKEEFEFTILNDEEYINTPPKPENIVLETPETPAPPISSAAAEAVLTEPEDDEGGGLQSCFEWLQAIISAVVIVVLLLTFVFRLVDVDGLSMFETLHDHDKVFVTSLLYEPQPGDIVVISHGQEYKDPIIKRVIATEGQSIQIDYDKGQVIVDGVIIDEPYLSEAMEYKAVFDNPIPDIVPEGMIFVMGDNRNNSLDSRSQRVGLIHKDDIIGKAQAVVFPFSNFKSLS